MAFILSYQAGMRVGEIAALTIRDVLEADGRTMRSQVRLSSEITKGGHTGEVLVSDRFQMELGNDSWKISNPKCRARFSAAAR